jgi:hypothetical protein
MTYSPQPENASTMATAKEPGSPYTPNFAARTVFFISNKKASRTENRFYHLFMGQK